MTIVTHRAPCRARASTLALVTAFVLAACGSNTASDQQIPREGEATEPITSRAVAAIALQYLPQDTSLRKALFVDETSPRGLVGTELRYRAGEGYDGDLVEVGVLPRKSATEYLEEIAGCSDSPQCATLDDGLHMLWETEAPEEDPGLVFVMRAGEDDVSYVLSAGALITGDPRKLELTPSVDTMAEIVKDPLLHLRTTPAAIRAGADLDRWKGGEVDPASLEQVPHNDFTIAANLVWPYGDDWTYVGPSPLKSMLGPKTVGGRVRTGSPDILPGGPGILDVLASRSTPAWLANRECPAGYRCRDFQRAFFAFRPASGEDPGDAWLFDTRRDGSSVALRTRGGRLPGNARAATGPAGAHMHISNINGTDFLPVALSTTRSRFEHLEQMRGAH